MTTVTRPVITFHLLEHHGACEDEVDRFRDEFPTGVEVTVANARSLADEWDLDWAVERLLTRDGRREVCPAYVDLHLNLGVKCLCDERYDVDDGDVRLAEAFARAALKHGLARDATER